jgi:hypothetical protein
MGASSSKGDVSAAPIQESTKEEVKTINRVLSAGQKPEIKSLPIVHASKEVIKDTQEESDDRRLYLVDESVEMLKYKF